MNIISIQIILKKIMVGIGQGYRVLALNGDGEWREIADTSKAKKLINKSQLFRKTFNQLQSHINELRVWSVA